MLVFRVETPSVGRYHHLGGAYCIHFSPEDGGIATQKTDIDSQVKFSDSLLTELHAPIKKPFYFI